MHHNTRKLAAEGQASVFGKNRIICFEKAIYLDLELHEHPLTPEQFSSEEEFRFWKMWSDENYHDWELADHMLLTRPLYRKLLFPILRRRRSHSPN